MLPPESFKAVGRPVPLRSEMWWGWEEGSVVPNDVFQIKKEVY
jgi:hypothetical protein